MAASQMALLPSPLLSVYVDHDRGGTECTTSSYSHTFSLTPWVLPQPAPQSSLCLCVFFSQIVLCFYTVAHVVIKRPRNTASRQLCSGQVFLLFLFFAALMMDGRPLPAADERLNEREAAITAGLKEEEGEEEEEEGAGKGGRV